MGHNQEYKMKISKEQMVNIYYNEYVNGGNLSKLDRKYNIYSGYFSRWFKVLGFEIRNNDINSKLYTFNEDYFTDIDNQDKAYWLGFIFADGYILSKRKHSNRKLGVSLSEKDICHLEKFKECIEGNMPIPVYNVVSGYNLDSKYCRILLTSKKTADDLISHGVLEHKTNIITFPSLREDLKRHFIRGYFDGDGSVWKQKGKDVNIEQYSISFIGTDELLTKTMECLLNDGAILRTYKINKRKENQIVSNFKFGGNNNTIRFLNYIYNDSHIYLERKYNIYLDLIKLIDSRS